MNALSAKGTWNIAKGKVKQMFAQLAEDDMQLTEGIEDELIGRIQKRTSQAGKHLTANECSSCRSH
jgi:uncharacterized protein YjbJ (UPF0337 family)